MKWNKLRHGNCDIPTREHNGKELLVKIDHNCGYLVVIWDDNNKKFLPLSYYNQEIATNLITGASDWCEIFP